MGELFTPRSILSFATVLLLNLLLLYGTALHAQDVKSGIDSHPINDGNALSAPASNPSTYSLTVHAQIVLLDVSVNNAKGQAVHGLTSKDFTILEDGVPQKVVSFEAIEPRRAQDEKTIPIHSTEELDRLEPNLPVSIVVLDELSTSFEDEYFVRYSLEKYLSRQGEVLDQPMMLIARTMDRTIVLHDYTTSKQEILDTLKRHRVGNDWRADNANFTAEQMGAAFSSLISIARATQGHPGHKNLIWIGRGFPPLSLDQLPTDESDALEAVIASCVDILRNARITLYALDPAGVVATPENIDGEGDITNTDPFGGAITFDTMVNATGGLSLHGRNDVDHMIGTAVSDGETFYTLAYREAAPSDEDPKKFRKIKVVLKDPTLIATTRQGYYPVTQEISALKDEPGKLSSRASFDLSSAIPSLMIFDGVPLTIARDNSVADRFHISFPVASLGLNEQEGKLTGAVTLIVLCYDRTGKLIDNTGRIISLHFADLKPGEVEARKVQIEASVNTQPPAARIRFIVRANGNGRIGTDNFFLVDRNTLKDPATGIKPIHKH